MATRKELNIEKENLHVEKFNAEERLACSTFARSSVHTIVFIGTLKKLADTYMLENVCMLLGLLSLRCLKQNDIFVILNKSEKKLKKSSK